MIDAHPEDKRHAHGRNSLAKQRERCTSLSFGGGRPFASVDWQRPLTAGLFGVKGSDSSQLESRDRLVR